jgi:peroxiredoxin
MISTPFMDAMEGRETKKPAAILRAFSFHLMLPARPLKEDARIQSADVVVRAARLARRRAALLILTAIALHPCLAGAQIGEKAAGSHLTDSEGKLHALEDYEGKIVVLEFWSFKCPVSLAYDDRVAALLSRYGNRDVIVLGIASNKDESAVEVKRNAENLHLPFPVLMDPDGSVADRLGATHTPSIAILDGTGVLRYRGAIDNNKRDDERGRIPYAAEALEALLSGQPLPMAETKVFGCSIKR